MNKKDVVKTLLIAAMIYLGYVVLSAVGNLLYFMYVNDYDGVGIQVYSVCVFFLIYCVGTEKVADVIVKKMFKGDHT